MIIRAKYPDRCRNCGTRIEPGERVEWHPGVVGVLCEGCSPEILEIETMKETGPKLSFEKTKRKSGPRCGFCGEVLTPETQIPGTDVACARCLDRYVSVTADRVAKLEEEAQDRAMDLLAGGADKRVVEDQCAAMFKEQFPIAPDGLCLSWGRRIVRKVLEV